MSSIVNDNKIKKIIPFFIAYILFTWIVLPVLLSTGVMSGSPVFIIILFLLEIIATILFWGLIIYAFFRMIKNAQELKTKLFAEAAESPDKTEQEENYIPDGVHEDEYMMQTGRSNDEIQRKIYEQEIFALQHPTLYALQKRVIPFIWMFITLCIILTILIGNGIIELPF